MNFFREYRIEIAIMSLFGFGIFLLLERLEIKQTIYLWIRHYLVLIYRFVKGVWRSARDIEGSDMVGIILILAALYLILVRFRVRIVDFYPHRSDCPRCGVTSLRRIPRSIVHRVLQLLLNTEIRRLVCRDCGREFIEMKSKKKGKGRLDDPGAI